MRHRATVWVETDGPCEVEVLDSRDRTFSIEGHHYALVVVEGLEPGVPQPYEVLLNGRRAWPLVDSDPPSVLRRHAREHRSAGLRFVPGDRSARGPAHLDSRFWSPIARR